METVVKSCAMIPPAVHVAAEGGEEEEQEEDEQEQEQDQQEQEQVEQDACS